MKWKVFAALLAMLSVAAHADTLPATTDMWRLWTADAGAATMAVVPGGQPTAVSNIVTLPNDPAAWAASFFDPTTSSFTADAGALKLVIGKVDDKAWHTYFSQRDLPIKEGETYTVKFRAKADAERPILVIAQAMSGDYHAVGLVQNAPLTTEWKTYSYTFKAVNVPVDGVHLAVQAGQATGTVWVADLSVAPVSGSVIIPAPTSALQITNKAVTDDWKVNIASKPQPLVDGHTYRLSYWVKSDKPGRVNAPVQIMVDDYHTVAKVDFRGQSGPMWRKHSVTFTASGVKPDKTSVVVCVGNIPGAVYIGDVDLSEVK
ncbi:MAG TPA: carbohydrate binding domain-containing protein [Capsulimonadaceae bacterium]|jgi:hypothetical protein